MSRIVVVYLGNGHKFNSMKDVQEELNSKFLELAPTNCSNYDKIPVMTIDESVGEVSLIDTKLPGLIV
jgi:hypothetical protein